MAQTDNIDQNYSDEVLEIIKCVFYDYKYPSGFKNHIAEFIQSAINHGIDTVVVMKALEITRDRCDEIGGWWDGNRFIRYAFVVWENLTKNSFKT